MFGFSARSGLWEIRISCIMRFNYLKNHSRNLHAPFDGIFRPNSVVAVRCDALIRAEAPINCGPHPAESFFKHALAKKENINEHI